jgi:CheY-like chemotaxis protein
MIGQGPILLADDNPSEAELTLHVLDKHAHCSDVVWVQDGEAALDYVFRTGSFADRRGANPRLMLLDLHMPRIDGLEVLARIKAAPATRPIPVIIMSKSDADTDMEQSYALHANGYMVKEVDFNQFTAQVTQLGLYWTRVNRARR